MNGFNSLTEEGQEFRLQMEDTTLRVVKTCDWYQSFLSHGEEWVPIDFPLKPVVEYRVVDGIPVSIGMSSDEWVEAMLGL